MAEGARLRAMNAGHPAYELVIDFLRIEIVRMRAAGIPVGEDDYRGLHIPDSEVERILQRPGGESPSHVEHLELLARLDDLTAKADGRLGEAIRLFRLSSLETGCLLLCLVSELDLSVERLLAYVQDDVSKRRPRVDLAARMFVGEAESGQPWTDAFHPARAFSRWKLVQLMDEPGQPFTPLRGRYLALEPGIAMFLLGSDEVSDALHPFVTHRRQDELQQRTAAFRDGNPTAARLAALPVGQLSRRVVTLSGSDESFRGDCASVLAAGAGLGLLACDFQELAEKLGWEPALALALREGGLRNAAVYLRSTDTLSLGDWGALLEALGTEGVAPLVILAASVLRPPWPGLTIPLPASEFEARRRAWQEELGEQTIIESGDLDSLADTFDLPANKIADAGRIAAGSAIWRAPDDPRPVASEVFAAARAAASPVLTSFARRVTPRHSWNDIVLPDDTRAQLRELTGRARHVRTVLDDWGFANKAAGRGATALFAGPSGTGKTMAAEIIARELQLELYAIDLSGVVSKYIGETEKNLETIFTEASAASALLFFDEADALFGKRSEVKDAHDRYANIETAYLLQRIESYSGPVILATNLKLNLDEAFLRRLDFAIDFPFPDEPERLLIWRGAFPPAAPLGGDVDYDFLARQFRLAGGNIRNIALAAAFMAASDGCAVGMSHLMAATRREYQKLGRMIAEVDFGAHTAGRLPG